MRNYIANLLITLVFLFNFIACGNIIIDFNDTNIEGTQSLFLRNMVLPSGLSLDEGLVEPDLKEYNLTVPIAYSTIDIDVIPSIFDANILIEKGSQSGSSFSDFPLEVGDNLFTITLSKGNLESVYYLNITKWKALSDYIKPDLPIDGQKFGWHLSMHGDYVAVGAPEENTVAGAKAGAVYIFKRENNNWVQKQRIESPNPDADDLFGHAVYIYNDILLVGAPHEDSTSSGISTDTSGANNSGTEVGAAYLFKRSGETWNLEYYIKPSDPSSWAIFAWSVALDKGTGKTLLINSPWDSQGAGYSGAVYVFDYLSGVLTQNTKLKADVPTVNDVFGGSMYIADGRIAVGVPYRDEGGNDSGAVYVFEKPASTWTQTAKLLASNPGAGDYFGFSLVIYGNSILIGAPQEDSDPALGLLDNSLSNSGIVYEFVENAGVWSQESYFKGFNAGAGDQFGWNMDFDTSSLVIGAPYEDGSGQGIGPAYDDLSADSGATYVFKKDVYDNWEQDSYIKSINSDSGDHFGHSVIIDDGRLLIVASDEESMDPNDQNNNAGTGVGAVYFYE